jgi:hypothetical protein
MESRFIAGETPPLAAVGNQATDDGGADAEQVLPMTAEEFVDIN